MHVRYLGIMLLWLSATMSATMSARGQDAKDPISARTSVGRFEIVSSTLDRNRLVSLSQRFGFALKGPAKTPPPKDGSPHLVAPTKGIGHMVYQAYVPAAYEPHQPHGVFVYISTDESGGPPAEYHAALDRRRMIWVGADGSGEKHTAKWRMWLALDAVRHLADRYTIDLQRTYVGGYSDGAHIAAELAVMYPDLFGGGYYLSGQKFAPAPKQKLQTAGDGKPLPRPPPLEDLWGRPNAKGLAILRKNSRFVLFTAKGDMTNGETKTLHALYKHRGYEAWLQEIEGGGPARPSAAHFERGIAALDVPLVQRAETLYKKSLAIEKRGKLGEAWAGYSRAAVHAFGKPFGADAEEKSDTLYAKFESDAAEAQRRARQGDRNAAMAAIRKLRAPWGKLAEDHVKQITDSLKKSRAAAAMRK